MGKGKKKSASAAAPTTPAVAPVIQKKPVAKSKCTSSEIDDIFGVAKSASASIPQTAPSIASTDSTEPSTSKSKQPTAASSAKQHTGSTSLPDGEVDEDDLTDDLQLLAERIRKNRQDKVNKVLSDASAAAASIAALRGQPREKLTGDKDDIFGAGGPTTGRKRTEEGYAIYKEDELGLTKKGGGDTADCPFDCDCCF